MSTLQNQVAKMKSGGLVYITQPTFPPNFSVFRVEPAIVDPHDSVWPSHLHFFNPLSAVAMLGRAGLHMIRFLTHYQEREHGPHHRRG